MSLVSRAITPDHQGRVFTLLGSLAGATAPLGLVVAAPITELVGVRSWYLAGRSSCLAMGIAGFFLPSVMQLEQPLGGGAAEETSISAGGEG